MCENHDHESDEGRFISWGKFPNLGYFIATMANKKNSILYEKDINGRRKDGIYNQ